MLTTPAAGSSTQRKAPPFSGGLFSASALPPLEISRPAHSTAAFFCLPLHQLFPHASPHLIFPRSSRSWLPLLLHVSASSLHQPSLCTSFSFASSPRVTSSPRFSRSYCPHSSITSALSPSRPLLLSYLIAPAARSSPALDPPAATPDKIERASLVSPRPQLCSPPSISPASPPLFRYILYYFPHLIPFVCKNRLLFFDKGACCKAIRHYSMPRRTRQEPPLFPPPSFKKALGPGPPPLALPSFPHQKNEYKKVLAFDF